MSEENDLKKLKTMKNGDNVTVNWFEEGGADVYMVNYHYIVFECMQYGGDERFAACLDTPEEVIKLAYSWT
ncbi:MAG: hypothetical protein V3U78_05485 [Thiotrichaceae bacterium]